MKITIEARPEEIGGGWIVRKIEDNVETYKGDFPAARPVVTPDETGAEMALDEAMAVARLLIKGGI